MNYFKTRDDLWNTLDTKDWKNCFAINFEKIDATNFDFKVSINFQSGMVPDTTKEIYNSLVINPDLTSWDKYKNSGVLAVQPWINEFLARYVAKADMKSKLPYLKQEVGLSPLNTPKVTGFNA